LTEICIVGNKSGYTTIQSKERIVLMETNSPASTNGESEFMLRQQNLPITIDIPADVTVVTQDRDTSETEMVQVEYDPKLQVLTHGSATAAYAVYRSLNRMRGLSTLPYETWLRTALVVAKTRLDWKALSTDHITA